MGCDVHFYIEYRCGNGMPWQADDHHVVNKHGSIASVSATGRNYNLFSLLAGVRGRSKGNFRRPLNLPDDVTDVIYKASEGWSTDAHSHSYMSLDEFKKVIFEEYNAATEDHKFKPTKRKDAFWDYDDPAYSDFNKHPPDYTTLITYCEKLKEEKSLDKQILGPDTTSEVQVRLVFWFDN